MATRNDAHDVVEEDEEEQRSNEGEVLLPRVAQDGLAHVIACELDEVLHTVHKEALRHEALCLLLLEDEHHNAEKRDGNEHPEDVLGETKRGVSDDGMGHEAVEQLVHRIRQLGKRVHYSSFLPQFASA